MNEKLLLKLLICFIIGWLLSQIIGNGFSVGSWYRPWRQKVVDKRIKRVLNIFEKILTNL